MTNAAIESFERTCGLGATALTEVVQPVSERPQLRPTKRAH